MPTYEKMLCPRCKSPIIHINEFHLGQSKLSCVAKKRLPGAFVYLMLDTTNDLLKIGYSSDPFRRHKEIVHGSANVVNLLGFFPGSKLNELIVHNLFKNVRVKREWFQHDVAIVDYFTGHPLFKDTSDVL